MAKWNPLPDDVFAGVRQYIRSLVLDKPNSVTIKEDGDRPIVILVYDVGEPVTMSTGGLGRLVGWLRQRRVLLSRVSVRFRVNDVAPGYASVERERDTVTIIVIVDWFASAKFVFRTR